MPQCMFCQRKGRYSFIWGAGRRWSVDYLCEKHREEQDWELVVPMRNEYRFPDVIESLQ